MVVQRDLLSDFGDWQVLRESSPGALRFGVLTPSYSAQLDAGDLPSILVPPGSRVSITIPAGEPSAILRCAAGVDLSVARSLPEGSEPIQVQFHARVDDTVVMNLVVPVHRTENSPRTAKVPQVWHWLGAGKEGIELRGGQTLTLGTRLRGGNLQDASALKLGFGGLYTETAIPTKRKAASPEQPNLILVVMDTERFDRTSEGGYSKATTPHLARLASRGTSFDDAWVTAPWTWPATASILTGLEPLSHGVTSHEACYLRHRVPSLPKLLQERGFTSAGFSCNPLIVGDKGFDAGFEHFETTKDFTPGAEVMPKVEGWLRANAERRFFLYLHLVDPHDPHRPLDSELARLGGAEPDSFPRGGYRAIGGRLRKQLVEQGASFNPRDHVDEAQRQWVNDAYDACVATGDVHLGRLLDLLAELDLEGNTVVAYTSDHGEELFDHGLTNHAHSLHSELMRAPLVIAGPGIPAGERVAARVSNRHLATTLARLGGGELPVSDALDLLAAEVESEEQLFFHTTKGIWNDRSMVEIFGLLEEQWFFHWAPLGRPFRTPDSVDVGLGQWRLYARSEDPTESVEVADRFPEVVERMRRDIEAWRQSKKDQASSFGAGAATRNLLEGVGYIEVDSSD